MCESLTVKFSIVAKHNYGLLLSLVYVIIFYVQVEVLRKVDIEHLCDVHQIEDEVEPERYKSARTADVHEVEPRPEPQEIHVHGAILQKTTG